MKKTLISAFASLVLVGSTWAQTAAPAVNAAVTQAKAVAASAVANVVKPAAAPASQAAPSAPAAPAAAATGGGAGKVWVNGKVYHCEGSKYYGKTKKGEYMSEADAKAKGAHGVKGQTCTK